MIIWIYILTVAPWRLFPKRTALLFAARIVSAGGIMRGLFLRRILWAISLASVGSHSKAPGPPTSGMEEVLEVTTGVPQAIASSKGIPKLSRNDVYRKAKAPL